VVRVFGLNDGAEAEADLEFGLFSLDGAYPIRQRQRVTLPANASTVLAVFEAGSWDAAGVDRHAAFAVLSRDGAEIARDRLLLPVFKDMQWPAARVAITRERDSAVFACETFAWRVCLDLEGRADIPDNFFDIFPGRPVRLPWPASLPDAKIRAIGNQLFTPATGAAPPQGCAGLAAG
jgi:beta-mannosidase